MMNFVLKFLILFMNIVLCIRWSEILFTEEKGRALSFPRCAASAGLAVCLCLWKSFFQIFEVEQLILVIAVAGLSKYLLRVKPKLLISSVCLCLSIIYLFDTVVWLLLKEFLQLSLIMCVCIWISLKIFFYIWMLLFPGNKRILKEIKPYYNSIYGTPIVGFMGISFLSYKTFSIGDKSTVFIIWGILLAVIFLRISLVYSHIRYQKEKEYISTINMQKELLEKNYSALNQAYAVNAKLFHDFHRHLEIMLQMANKSKDTDMVKYIENLSEPLKEIASVIWIGDETVDYIINSRYSKAKEKGIQMEMNIEFPNNTNIRPNDLCTILSNLLDNAIEACERAAGMGTQESPFIYLTIRRIQNILIIKLENSSLQPEYNSDGERNTAKEDKTLHGYGMKNIESAVLKYDGVLQSSYEEHIYRTIITLSFEGVKIG